MSGERGQVKEVRIHVNNSFVIQMQIHCNCSLKFTFYLHTGTRFSCSVRRQGGRGHLQGGWVTSLAGDHGAGHVVTDSVPWECSTARRETFTGESPTPSKGVLITIPSISVIQAVHVRTWWYSARFCTRPFGSSARRRRQP